MKKILISGKASYIGTAFEKWLGHWPERYIVHTASTIHDEWKSATFDGYDAVLHVAGIAHVSTSPKMKEMYYKVNRDLAIEVAKKAKESGIKQFIFMSSIIIYGDDGKIEEKKVITKETIPQPSNFYGRSKLEADTAIQRMADNRFKPVIIRTPMVYGPGCKGNFSKLKKLAKWCFVFPYIDNQRSVVYIDNLCEFIKKIIDREASGIFFPQNKDYVATKDIINELRKLNGKNTRFIKLFNPTLKLLSKRIVLINKVFGNKVYDKSLSAEVVGMEYNLVGFSDSIKGCR